MSYRPTSINPFYVIFSLGDLKIKKNTFYNFRINYKYLFIFALPFARVAELVDALDSKSSVLGRAGSIPASSTKKSLDLNVEAFLIVIQ